MIEDDVLIKTFQDDADNIKKLIVEKKGKHYTITYYDIKFNQEIRLSATAIVVEALFEIIRRMIYKLDTGKEFLPPKKL